MKELSPTAEAIRRYKLNARGGYEEWSKVSCTENYRMHVPSMGFDVSGPGEIKEVIFRINPTEIKPCNGRLVTIAEKV